MQNTAQDFVGSIVTDFRKVNKVAFLGGAEVDPNSVHYNQAFEVAKILAANGYETVNGGGPGIMRASTQGAKSGGGKVLIVTYHPNKPKKHYEGVDIENKKLADEEILTLDYFDRTKVMLQNTDVHIVFYGSLGTISELGMTWISSWIHEPNRKPIILYGSLWENIIKAIHENLRLTEEEISMVKIRTTPQEVLDYLEFLNNRQ